jgi:LytS/YehU family sensor histidine kinase
LAVICITILPLGVASDELRKKAARDRLVMATLSSSFWNWSAVTGNQIENPQIAKLFSPTIQLFQPNRKTGSLKIRPATTEASAYLSHWMIQEADPSGNPLQVTGILQNYSIEEERDAALAQARLAELEIQTLRSHLNPHLLFNCLTGLRGLIAQDPAKAREFSGNLARFLRAVVDSENQKTISLRQELAICEDFIRLEELRGRPLQLQVKLEDRDREVAIPPLTLVTLLENAAKHGLRRNGHPLPVTISADRPDSNHLCLRVQQPGTLQRPTDPKNHAGLDLIRRQLAMVLGPDSRLELLEQSSGSVVANLILPA